VKKLANFFVRENGKVICHLCPVECKLKDSQAGSCGVRINNDGSLYTYTYGTLISFAVDPVEKKPLFHFLPGHRTFTIATPGCNLHCKGCQNWEISQVKGTQVLGNSLFENTYVPPEEVVNMAVDSGSESISFSYTEPVIFYEYMFDIAKKAKDKGLKTIMVSALYIKEEPLEYLIDIIDAFSIDLKFFKEDSYKKYSGAKLEPILKNIKKLFKSNKWLEITTLLVPQYLGKDQIKDIARWIAEELAPWVPWHISRFFPYHKAKDLPITPYEDMLYAYEAGKEAGLEYVYMGNIDTDRYEHTYCPSCGNLLIRRKVFYIMEINLKGNRCPSCNYEIRGIFKSKSKTDS